MANASVPPPAPSPTRSAGGTLHGDWVSRWSRAAVRESAEVSVVGAFARFRSAQACDQRVAGRAQLVAQLRPGDGDLLFAAGLGAELALIEADAQARFGQGPVRIVFVRGAEPRGRDRAEVRVVEPLADAFRAGRREIVP